MFRRHLQGTVLLLSLAATSAAAQASRPDAAAVINSGFGAVVAVGDNDVVVTEPNNIFRPGIVYVYRKGGNGAWAEALQIKAPKFAERDRFGTDLSLRGTDMLISAIPREGVGRVYRYHRGNGGKWTPAGELTATGVSESDRFGASVLLGDGVALVGAPGASDTAGTVFVFRWKGNAWVQSGKLMTADTAAPQQFGSALAMSGDHLLIAAAGRRGGRRGGGGPGGVYHFHRTPTGYVEVGALSHAASEESDGFGAAVAIAGDRAYVGKPAANGRTGAVAVYHWNAEDKEWQAEADLVPFALERRASFGGAIAATDRGVWIGARGSRDIYAFGRNADGWTGSTKLVADDGQGFPFGGALATGGGVAAVGIPGGDNGAGIAAIFEWKDGGWARASVVMSAPERMDPLVGGEKDCQDGKILEWDCQKVDVVSFLPVADIGGERGSRLNDLWGWTDSTTGREYVLIGRIDGTSFVDQTDPLHPRYLGNLPRTTGSPASIWRDIKVYKNHAYIVADGAGDHGMQVFDLTQLRTIREPRTFTETVHYDKIASAHNIVIDEATGFGFIVGASSGGTTCGGGLHMIDIRSPESPTFAGCFADTTTGRRGTGYSHDAQCVVYHGPDQDYQGHEICVGSNETAMSISDVTDKAHPKAIARVSYPNVAYAHQGWFTEDQHYFFSNDEGDEGNGSVPHTRTLVWDLEDLDDPILLTEYFATTTDTDHNLYIRGNYMYQSNYGAGFRVIDISNPAKPVEVGYFDTAPESIGCCSTWSNYPFFKSGVIPVTGGNAGIFFLKKREEPVP